MNLEKIIFGFFVTLALSLNLAFFIGEIDNPAHHDVITFFLVVIVNIIVDVIYVLLDPRIRVGGKP